MIRYPEFMRYRLCLKRAWFGSLTKLFADEMIEEVAAFPNGEYDDLVDSMTQALMRYRQGNFVQLPTDSWEKEEVSDRVRVYY
jgi:hypothetical protein